jgi:hypothetical protein
MYCIAIIRKVTARRVKYVAEAVANVSACLPTIPDLSRKRQAEEGKS